MKKRIYSKTLLFGLFFTIIILLVESIVQLKISFNFTLAFNFGLFTGLANFFLSDKSLERLEFSNVSKPKIFYTFVHILKFIIYGIVLFFSTMFLGFYTAFTCAFGMILNKIVIYFINLVIVPKEDNKRTVDKLDLPKDIIQKLKYNNFIKVMDLTEVNREKLLEFLSIEEVELVITSLKKYELFIKGELEAIIEDECVNV